MAAPLLAEAVGGTGVPRLHLRGRVRDDPRGRRRASRCRAPRRCRTTSGCTWSAAGKRQREGAAAVARGATILLAVLSIVLGIAFKGQNVAYMVGLAFAIAASANFPALVLSMFWRRFTTRGAQASILFGTVSTLRADLPVADDPDRSAETFRPPIFRIGIRGCSPFHCRSSSASSCRWSRPSRPRSRASRELEHQIHVGEEEPV